MKVSYEWLQMFFDKDTFPSLEEIEQKLMFHAFEIEGVEEVDGDSVIDIDVLPNRAADCLSHRGIAREISALFKIPMKFDPLREKVELVPEANSVNITLSVEDSCSYYTVAHIVGVEVKESPEWLKNSLEAIGQKSINNIVDATNYVLFELGRPTHVFDANKFEGEKPHVGTRLARSGEKITLLGGEEVELKDSMTIIIDVNSDIPIAVGGVKGGAHVEIDENTTEILVEVANFHPTQTRLTAQALKIRTDASARFENNMADKLADYGATSVVELILKVAGGKLQGYKSVGKLYERNVEVAVSSQRVSKLLGADISEKEIEDIFNRLEFEYSKSNGEFVVKAPFERRDINIPEEVIEEIGRIYGYSKIKSEQLPQVEKAPKIHKKYAYLELIRNTLTSLRFTEVYLYSLCDGGEVKLLNAFASDKDHLRSDLTSGITGALDKNEKQMPLLGLYDAVRIFEIGNIFLNKSEETHVCIGVRVAGGKKRKERTKEILSSIKNELEKVLGINLPESTDEVLEFNLDELITNLPDLEAYPEPQTVAEGMIYKAYSQYPFILRDIAVWTPTRTLSDSVLKVIEKYGGELLVRIDLFDEFEKGDKKSYAFHLVFQSHKKTLTDKEVGVIMQKIESEMQDKSWEVR